MKNRDKRSIGTNRTFNSRYIVHEMQQRKMLRDNLSIVGTRYVGNHRFSIGSEVPIYEIESMHALNQIIGYAKFNNRGYGDVWSSTYFGEHTTTVDGNGKDPGIKEVVAVGKAAGIAQKKCRCIAEEIFEQVENVLWQYQGTMK